MGVILFDGYLTGKYELRGRRWKKRILPFKTILFLIIPAQSYLTAI